MTATVVAPTLDEIARAAGVSTATVLRLAVSLGYAGQRRARAVPPELAALLVAAIRGEAIGLSTARLLARDPDAVLAGAEALAELARQQIDRRSADRTTRVESET